MSTFAAPDGQLMWSHNVRKIPLPMFSRNFSVFSNNTEGGVLICQSYAMGAQN
jgi:hypothetical protein